MAAQIRCGNITDHFFPTDGFSGTRSRSLGCRACAVSFQSYNYLDVSSRFGSGLGSKRMELLFKLKTYPAAKEDRRIRVSLKAPSIGQDNFEEVVLKSDVPVLVDFWADWCGPCKLVAPIIDWVAENYAGQLKVYKVETDPNPQLVDKYKPYGLPTLILFKDGEEVPGSRREGAITKAKLKALLDELLSTIAAR